MAQRFDTTSLRLAGEAAPLAESVAIRPQFSRGVFSTSENGTVLYGTSRHQITQLVWLDRDGRQIGTDHDPGRYERAALSPDEKTVAVEVIDPHLETPDIWLVEAVARSDVAVHIGGERERMPLWSPDGTRPRLSSPRDGNPPRMFEKMTNGGTETPFFRSDSSSSRPTGRATDVSSSTEDGTRKPNGTSGSCPPRRHKGADRQPPVICRRRSTSTMGICRRMGAG